MLPLSSESVFDMLKEELSMDTLSKGWRNYCLQTEKNMPLLLKYAKILIPLNKHTPR